MQQSVWLPSTHRPYTWSPHQQLFCRYISTTSDFLSQLGRLWVLICFSFSFRTLVETKRDAQVWRDIHLDLLEVLKRATTNTNDNSLTTYVSTCFSHSSSTRCPTQDHFVRRLIPHSRAAPAIKSSHRCHQMLAYTRPDWLTRRGIQ